MTMNVLIACEYSGKVRRAFAKRGHNVLSVDLLPADDGADIHWESHGKGMMRHYTGNVWECLGPQSHWDLMIAFPPCTHLSASGARYWAEKRADGRQQEAVEFFMSLASTVEWGIVDRCAIENPVGYMSRAWRKPDQYIQPWEHGHGETKKTGLWLQNLPQLTPTNIVEGREARIHKLPPSADRWKIRSETYQGIADAMADQWG